MAEQSLGETGMPSLDEGADRLTDDVATLQIAMRQALEDAFGSLGDGVPDANGYHHASPVDLHRMIPSGLTPEEQQIRFDRLLEMFRETFYDVGLDMECERTDTGIMRLKVKVRARS